MYFPEFSYGCPAFNSVAMFSIIAVDVKSQMLVSLPRSPAVESSSRMVGHLRPRRSLKVSMAIAAIPCGLRVINMGPLQFMAYGFLTLCYQILQLEVDSQMGT